MGFNIANMFSKGAEPSSQAPAPKPEPQQQPQQQQQKEPAESAFHKSQASDPNNPNAKTEPQEESPMDQFADLFTMEEKKEGEEDNTPDPDNFFSYDPNKLQERVNKLNFAQMEGADELSQKALEGDPKALMQLINGVAQQTFYQAAEFSSNVANRTAKESYTRSSEKLPSSVRSLMAKDTMEGLKPQFKHKALQPIVSSVQSQIETKYPDASPKEVSDMVNKYMESVAKTFGSGSDPSSTSSQDSSRSPNNGKSDFGDFFPGLGEL